MKLSLILHEEIINLKFISKCVLKTDSVIYRLLVCYFQETNKHFFRMETSKAVIHTVFLLLHVYDELATYLAFGDPQLISVHVQLLRRLRLSRRFLPYTKFEEKIKEKKSYSSFYTPIMIEKKKNGSWGTSFERFGSKT